MNIEELCARWLEENFNITPQVQAVRLLPQAEIDKGLGLMGVEFDFTISTGEVGSSVVFFEIDRIKDSSFEQSEAIELRTEEAKTEVCIP